MHRGRGGQWGELPHSPAAPSASPPSPPSPPSRFLLVGGGDGRKGALRRRGTTDRFEEFGDVGRSAASDYGFAKVALFLVREDSRGGVQLFRHCFQVFCADVLSAAFGSRAGVGILDHFHSGCGGGSGGTGRLRVWVLVWCA